MKPNQKNIDKNNKISEQIFEENSDYDSLVAMYSPEILDSILKKSNCQITLNFFKTVHRFSEKNYTIPNHWVVKISEMLVNVATENQKRAKHKKAEEKKEEGKLDYVEPLKKIPFTKILCIKNTKVLPERDRAYLYTVYYFMAEGKNQANAIIETQKIRKKVSVNKNSLGTTALKSIIKDAGPQPLLCSLMGEYLQNDAYPEKFFDGIDDDKTEHRN